MVLFLLLRVCKILLWERNVYFLARKKSKLWNTNRIIDDTHDQGATGTVCNILPIGKVLLDSPKKVRVELETRKKRKKKKKRK